MNYKRVKTTTNISRLKQSDGELNKEMNEKIKVILKNDEESKQEVPCDINDNMEEELNSDDDVSG